MYIITSSAMLEWVFQLHNMHVPAPAELLRFLSAPLPTHQFNTPTLFISAPTSPSILNDSLHLSMH
jgi:hypothetical protein